MPDRSDRSPAMSVLPPGRTIHFTRGAATSTAVQIDHVALSNAWQTGAAQLPADQRDNLAGETAGRRRTHQRGQG